MINIGEQQLNDIHTMMKQIGSTHLPPIFKDFFPYPEKLVQKMNEDQIHIYQKNKSGLINIPKFNDKNKPYYYPVNNPSYIHGNGSEPIEYFSFKKDGGLRPMGIANPNWYFTFIYNMLVITENEKSWLRKLYSEDMIKYTENSLSPILGESGGMMYSKKQGVFAYGYVGIINELNMANSYAFSKNQKLVIQRERAYPFFLATDIENYFVNIYTHSLEQIAQTKPFSEFKNNNEVKETLKFFDNYNKGINRTQTKGILQGPLSSTVSAELLGLAIDSAIMNRDNSKKNFVRFCDDFTFFSYNKHELENQIDKLDKIFRDFYLSRKTEKTKLKKDFFSIQDTNINEMYSRFTFLEDDSRIQISDFLDIEEYIRDLVYSNRTSQLRSFLTEINKFYKRNNFPTNYANTVNYFVPFILKLIHIYPIVNNHCYNFLDTVLTMLSPIYHSQVISLMYESLDYVDKNFADTEIQIWHYYLLSKFASLRIVNDVFEKLINKVKKEPSIIDPLLLVSFMKRQDFDENKKVYKLVLEQYKKDNNNNGRKNKYEGIGSSKWWPVIVQHFLSYKSLNLTSQKYNYIINSRTHSLIKKNARNQRKYNKDNIKQFKDDYKELGIFDYILDLSKERIQKRPINTSDKYPFKYKRRILKYKRRYKI